MRFTPLVALDASGILEECGAHNPRWRMVASGLILVLAASASVEAAENWRVQPLPQQKGAKFVIHDFKMLSPARGIAVGCLSQGRTCRPMSLVTADGGGLWKFIDMPEAGLTLFFLNEATGWMATARALWKTSNSGLSWEKLPESDATRGISSTYFRDERTGWTVGSRPTVHSTTDGGNTWEPVKVSGEVNTKPAYTSYDWIAFANERFGMIAGASVPPQSAAPGQSRELPHLTIFLDTRDGGITWAASTTSMFGRVRRVAFAPDGRGLGLIEFRRDFEFPSEVFALDWNSGQSSRSFRRKDVAVTDIGFDAQGTAWLAGIARSGRAAAGRVKAFRSADLSAWAEVPVDSRATASRVTLGLCCGASPWMATDTGALLRLSGD